MNLNHAPSRWLGAAAALAIVAFGGLTLEFGHESALPRGVVELGAIQAGDPMQLVAFTLPEIVVTAQPVEPSATRVAFRPKAQVLDGDALAPIAASAAGVLLK